MTECTHQDRMKVFSIAKGLYRCNICKALTFMDAQSHARVKTKLGLKLAIFLISATAGIIVSLLIDWIRFGM